MKGGKQKGGVVLVVEDDADIAFTCAEIIELEGMQTKVCHNGREAQLLLLGGLAVSVILLDMMMPVMDGEEFLTWLRSNDDHKATPVIVLSASILSSTTYEKADGFIPKPPHVETLLTLLQRMILLRSQKGTGT
jgi:two-component system response regulator ResD